MSKDQQEIVIRIETGKKKKKEAEKGGPPGLGWFFVVLAIVLALFRG